MDSPTNKLEQVLEGYKPIPMKTRMFYPRGFKLSNDFVNEFHREYDRLVGEGLNPKNLLERFGKALRFHVTEKRCYTDPVVESEDSIAQEGNKKKAIARALKGQIKPRPSSLKPTHSTDPHPATNPSERKHKADMERWSEAAGSAKAAVDSANARKKHKMDEFKSKNKKWTKADFDKFEQDQLNKQWSNSGDPL
jgi:hypothetical protein